MSDRLIAVGVPVPGLGRLTYRVPDGQPLPPKGARVSVPLGGRTVTGCVIDPHAVPPQDATLREVSVVLDTVRRSAAPWRRRSAVAAVEQRFASARFPFRHDRALPLTIVRGDPGAKALDIPGRDHMLAVGDRVFKTGVLEFLGQRP